MFRTITIYILILSALVTRSQVTGVNARADSCLPPANLTGSVDLYDVTLNWNSPSVPGRDKWDVQFLFPLAFNNGEAGAETDGSYFYTSMWNGDAFYKYSLDGTYEEEIVIDGVYGIRDMAWVESEGMFYGSNATDVLYRLDFQNQIPAGMIPVPGEVRAIAYNPDEDVFYANNWSTDIMVFDRQSGALVNSFPVGAYGSFYGFAYDSWSSGGPFLWGFSQDGSGNELVQIKLPEGTETGFTMDLSFLANDTASIAGGLFTHEGLIPGTVTIGGVIQNDVFFGLELATISPNFFLGGYNVYRDGLKLNDTAIQDTSFTDTGLPQGIYQYGVTAVYVDSLGAELCESAPAGPIDMEVLAALVLGGNAFAGSKKIDVGMAYGYRMQGNSLVDEYSTVFDTLGYYFFYPLGSFRYYVKAVPSTGSAYYDDYVPTYYGNSIHWEDASLIHLQQNMFNADISLIPLVSNPSGNGSISGSISAGQDAGRSGPMTGIPVLLLNNAGECIGLDYTDNGGQFHFPGLALGTYRILGEIVGKSMSPLVYTLTSGEPDLQGIQLIVTENQIVLGVDEVLPSWIEMISEVYPNPSSASAYIEVHALRGSQVILTILDLAGKQVINEKTALRPGMNRIVIPAANLKEGIYFLRMVLGDVVVSRKFVVL